MFGDHLYNTANLLPDFQQTINGVSVHGAVVVPDKGLRQVIPAFVESISPTPVFTATQVGLPQTLRYAEKTDFAPRVGFAWRATADGKTVIRGGYGKFIETTLGQLVSGAWGVESSDVAQFTNTITNGKAQLTFPYPFPSNLAQPGSQAFQFSYNMHYKDPFVQQWNLTIERDLGFQTGLRLFVRRQPRKGFGVLQRSDASTGQHHRLCQGKGQQPISDLVRHQQLHQRRRQQLSSADCRAEQAVIERAAVQHQLQLRAEPGGYRRLQSDRLRQRGRRLCHEHLRSLPGLRPRTVYSPPAVSGDVPV